MYAGGPNLSSPPAETDRSISHAVSSPERVQAPDQQPASDDPMVVDETQAPQPSSDTQPSETTIEIATHVASDSPKTRQHRPDWLEEGRA